MAESDESGKVAPVALGAWELVVEDSLELDWHFDYGDEANGVVASATHQLDDGWSVTVRLRREEGRTVFLPWTFTPPAGREGDWLTSTIFKRLSMPDIREAIQRDLENPDSAKWLPASWFDTFTVMPRPGQAGRADMSYALWAKRYVDALDVAPRHPVRYLAEQYPGESEKAIQRRLTKAGERGILVRQRGKVGGHLTETGKRLTQHLDENRKEGSDGQH
jgi:hypothetical protein